jgi:hypothetical protein
MDLYYKFVEVTGILYTRVFQGGFFFLDLWSINHMWSGFMIYLIATALHIKRPLLIIPACLIGYEIFEILLTYFAINVFIPEIIKDQFTDVFVGFAGSCAGFYLVSNYNHLRLRYQAGVQGVFLFFVSMSFAFLWMVFSRTSVCSEGSFVTLLNLIIFFLWLSQAYTTIVVFRKYGLLVNIKPWLIFILTFVVTTLLNFGLITLSDNSMVLKPDVFITWIYSIEIKIAISPFLPFLLLAAHGAFVKLIAKSVAGFSSDRLICRSDFSGS